MKVSQRQEMRERTVLDGDGLGLVAARLPYSKRKELLLTAITASTELPFNILLSLYLPGLVVNSIDSFLLDD
jgi:hypothetical protein